MTRAVAITLAGKTGEEQHVITLTEMAGHNHGGGNHGHILKGGDRGSGAYSQVPIGLNYNYMEATADGGSIQTSGAIIATQGGNGGHENVQPTVFVPYIVKLDD
jgi:microcystin-dependent protein